MPIHADNAWPAQTIAIMLQNHIAEYGPLPDNMGEIARAAVAGDGLALTIVAIRLAEIEEAAR